MTKNQLQRLSRAVLVELVLDRDETLQVALATAAAPPEPAEAITSLALAARDRLAGLALGLIEAAELAQAAGRWCATGRPRPGSACRWTRLRLPLLKGGAVNRP